MACTLSVNVPEVRTGVTETLTINESVLSGTDQASLIIEMGAGTLNINPGGTSTVQGKVDYNVEDWKPQVTNSGKEIRLSQTNNKSVGIPNGQIVNAWDLQLGKTPLALSITTGANEGVFDLSGLSIGRLTISDGASKTSVNFNTPNPITMDRLEYHTGASEVSLFGLANARVEDVEFNGGAGSYKLDFSGQLVNDINVKIGAGMSDMTLTFPSGSHAIITINGGLSNINANGSWTINGSTYEMGTGGPTITITIDMAVGNLNLVQN
jgi:hypothetical protein